MLGPFRAAQDEQALTGFESSKVRALLAYLAVEGERAHSREKLAGLFWPEHAEAAARRNLRQALSNLRITIADQSAPTPFLLAEGGEIAFNPHSDHWLDVAEFEALLEANRTHAHRYAQGCPVCAQRSMQAVGLYRAPFLEGLLVADSIPFQDWLTLQRERYHRQTAAALHWLVGYHECRGEYAAALDYARRLVELDPWREEAHREVMRSLALSGERSAALRQYQTCRRVLAEELHTEPEQETTDLYARILAGESIPTASLPPLRLPTVLTPFIGRQEELEVLLDLLLDPATRLVTLVGPGGVGKTRLALQLAVEAVCQFPQGVTFVPLSSLAAPQFLLTTIAEALGIVFQDQGNQTAQLLDFLRPKRTLLLLDGFERLLNGVKLLVRILKQAPGVVLLVTSRSPLRLQAEHLFQVGGLSYPELSPEGSGLWEMEQGDSIAAYSAPQLFAERASRVRADFTLDKSNLADVVQVCQLVEGLPLAIELAAAWARQYPPAYMAEELGRGLDLLAIPSDDLPERHRSMRVVLKSAWERLPQAERVVLRRASVFRGSFDLEAAAQITGAKAASLAELADRSLLRSVGDLRFSMHDLLRQFAAERLSTRTQEEEQALALHSRYYAALLEGTIRQVREGSIPDLTHLELEFDNLWAGWEWSLKWWDTGLIERYVEGLALFLRRRNRYQEMVELLERSLSWKSPRAEQPVGREPQGQDPALVQEGSQDRLLRADWRRRLGEAYYSLGRMPESRTSLLRVLELVGSSSPRSALGMSLGLGVQLARQAGYRLLPRQRGRQTQIAEHLALLQAARACERLAQIYFFMDQGMPASYYSLLGLNLAEAALPSSELARLYASTSMAMAIIPLHRLANHYIQLGLKMAHLVAHPFSLAWVLELSGVYYCGVGRFREMEGNVNRAAEIFQRLGDLRRWEECLIVLASGSTLCADFERSTESCRRMYESAQKRGDVQVQRWGLSGMAENRLHLGRLEEAVALCEEALALPVEIADYTTDLGCYGVLAAARLRLGQGEAALAAADLAGKMLKQMSPTSYTSLAGYAGVAEVYISLWGRSQEGDTHLEEKARWACAALGRFARVFPVAQPRSYLLRGTLKQLEGRPRQARAAWQKGLATAGRLGMPHEAGLLRAKLAEVP